MGQNNFRYSDESPGVPGAPIGDLLVTRSAVVGGFASAVYTITVSTNTDGATYTHLMTGVSGNQVSITATGGADATATAAAIALAIRSNADASGAWALTQAAGVLTVAAVSTGTAYSISTVDAKLTVAQTTTGAAGGTNVGYGLAIEEGTDFTAHVADGSGTLQGISVRQNAGLSSAFDDQGTPAGEVLTMLQMGKLEVLLDSGVAAVLAADDVYYRTGGTGTIGAFRTAADGGNTVQLTSARWQGPAKRINGSSLYSAVLLFSVV